MSPPDRFPPHDPREWMNRARSNLAMAKNRIPDAYLEDLCFEAQQAAEKAIKAVMIKRGSERLEDGDSSPTAPAKPSLAILASRFPRGSEVAEPQIYVGRNNHGGRHVH